MTVNFLFLVWYITFVNNVHFSKEKIFCDGCVSLGVRTFLLLIYPAVLLNSIEDLDIYIFWPWLLQCVCWKIIPDLHYNLSAYLTWLNNCPQVLCYSPLSYYSCQVFIMKICSFFSFPHSIHCHEEAFCISYCSCQSTFSGYVYFEVEEEEAWTDFHKQFWMWIHHWIMHWYVVFLLHSLIFS